MQKTVEQLNEFSIVLSKKLQVLNVETEKIKLSYWLNTLFPISASWYKLKNIDEIDCMIDKVEEAISQGNKLIQVWEFPAEITDNNKYKNIILENIHPLENLMKELLAKKAYSMIKDGVIDISSVNHEWEIDLKASYELLALHELQNNEIEDIERAISQTLDNMNLKGI